MVDYDEHTTEPREVLTWFVRDTTRDAHGPVIQLVHAATARNALMILRRSLGLDEATGILEWQGFQARHYWNGRWRADDGQDKPTRFYRIRVGDRQYEAGLS